MGSEFGVHRKERDEPRFGRFGVQRKNLFFFLFFFFYFFLLLFFFLYFFLIFFSFFFHFFLLLLLLYFFFFSFFFHLFFYYFFSLFFFSSFSLFLSPNSEPAEPGFGPVLSLNSEPARVQSSEKGTGLSPNQGSARFLLQTPNLPGFEVHRKELAFLETPNLPNQGYTRSFSELRTCRARVIPVLSPNSELRAKTRSWTILEATATENHYLRTVRCHNHRESLHSTVRSHNRR